MALRIWTSGHGVKLGNVNLFLDRSHQPTVPDLQISGLEVFNIKVKLLAVYTKPLIFFVSIEIKNALIFYHFSTS